MTKKRINGVLSDMTESEEAQYEIDKVAMQTSKDAETAFEANKASGKAKLKAGEALNDAELSALFGD